MEPRDEITSEDKTENGVKAGEEFLYTRIIMKSALFSDVQRYLSVIHLCILPNDLACELLLCHLVYSQQHLA